MLRKSFTALLLLVIIGMFLFMRMTALEHAPASDTTVITLTAIPGLQFDQVRFRVKPGSQVKVILKNQDDMSHNLVFTKPGTRMTVVNAAIKLEEKGPEMNYIPKLLEVLWSIPVLSPGEEQSVSFRAPDESGVYPYVCTFPGHGFVMFGAMYVTMEETLPPLETDENVPPARKKGEPAPDHHGHHASPLAVHPYALNPPYLYRAYMEDSSPASIAVHLPHKLSYCWDADACELRYAWQGDFVDNTGLWKGKPNAVAKVLGDIFYRNKTPQPIRIGNSKDIRSKVEYKGYQLKDRYPEFHYTVDGIDVYELIRSSEDGRGLLRTFRIPEAKHAVWFCADSRDGVSYEISGNKISNGTRMISPAEAREFTVVMTKKGSTK